MMDVIRSQEDFERYVNDKLVGLFEGKLERQMKKILSDTIQSNAITSKSSRSASGGFDYSADFSQNAGVADPRSFIVKSGLHDFSIEIYPGAQSQDPIFKGYEVIPGGMTTEFASRLEEGRLMDLSAFFKSGGRVRQYRPARPFIQEAQQKVDALLESEVENLFK